MPRKPAVRPEPAAARSRKRAAAAAAPRKRATRPAGAAAALEPLAERLATLIDALQHTLAEAPRADDFQPLADHLYEFARLAPALLEPLQQAPRFMAPLERTAKALQEVSETLHFAHDSFRDALLKLPRADEFEPLLGPLREFARVAPALAESLAQALRVARPLNEAVERLDAAARNLALAQASLEARHELAAAAATPPDPAGFDAPAAARRMELARLAILEALADLPRDREYARVASHLRELASVSPSLLEWLGEAQALSAPLEQSVAGLRAAAAELLLGQRELEGMIPQGRGPRGDEER